jgi:hypothetical protein
MKALSLSALTRLTLACLTLSSATGCLVTGAHYSLQENTNALLKVVKSESSLPANKAKFCLERAVLNYVSAERNSDGDRALIGMAAAVGLGGLTTQAMGAAWPSPTVAADANHGTKKDIEVVGTTLVAGAAGLIAVRTAFGLNDIALAKRTAAAKQVDAALIILAKYALADDPKEVVDDGFSGCRDADIDVANHFPGSSAADSLKQAVVDAQNKKDQAAKETSGAKEVATKAKKEVAAAKEAAIKADTAHLAAKADAAKATGPAKAPADKMVATQAQEKNKADETLKQAEASAAAAAKDLTCKEAKADVVEKQVAATKALGALRRATFFLTSRDVQSAEAEYRITETELADSHAHQKDACP